MRQSSGSASIFGFTGEPRDPTTGFTFLRARYLDPGLGRFTQPDTVQPNAPGTQGWCRRANIPLPSRGYDSGGRLETLTDWLSNVTTFTYDDNRRRTAISRPNGVTSSHAYDAASQVTSITHTGPSGMLMSLAYNYDAAGQPWGSAAAQGTAAAPDWIDMITVPFSLAPPHRAHCPWPARLRKPPASRTPGCPGR